MRRLFDGWIACLYLFLLAPLLCVVAVSFNGSVTPSFPPTTVSLHWYRHAFEVDLFRNGMTNSALLALAAAALSMPLGIAAALALHRARFRGRALLEALFLAPLVVPGIVIGIAILIAFAQFDLDNALWRLLAAHVLIVLPYWIRTVLAALARLDPLMGEAAATLGAAPLQRLWHVTLPLIRPGILAGAIFSFIISFDDAAVSLFLTDAHTVTLPIGILSYLEYNFDPSIAAISSALILGTVAAAAVIEHLFGLKRMLGA